MAMDSNTIATIEDPEHSARSAGLRYVSDRSPGFRRLRAGQNFKYLDVDGKRIVDPETLAHIKSLAIPPAWQDVWICRWKNGHIQATGRDAKGRKQYRYHKRWAKVRDEVKYERMINFGKALPGLREKIEEALRMPGLPREKVLATVIRMLDLTGIRIGNEEYARSNNSYGLTTLLNRHVQIEGARIQLQFMGKSKIRHSIKFRDKRLANIIKRMRDLPGQDLFQYLDEAGESHTIGSSDVNDYLREITGEDYTAKDFRTWTGTMLATLSLLELAHYSTQQEAKRNIEETVKTVAAHLGNTPKICRSCYIHPAVFATYMDEGKWQQWRACQESVRRETAESCAENIVIDFLEQHAAIIP